MNLGFRLLPAASSDGLQSADAPFESPTIGERFLLGAIDGAEELLHFNPNVGLRLVPMFRQNT